MSSDNKSKGIPLGLKLSLMISLLVIGGISILSITILSKQSELQNEQVADFGRAMAQQLAASTTEPLFTDDWLSLQLMINNFVKLPRVTGAVVINIQLKVLAEAGRTDSLGLIKRAIVKLEQSENSISETRQDGTIAVTQAIQFRNVIGGYLYIVVQTETLVTAYTNNLQVILLVCLLIALAALIAAHYISRHVSQPISELLDATSQLSTANFKLNMSDRRNDEIGKLIDAINELGQGLYKKGQVEKLLGRFLAKDVADQVLTQLDTVSVGGDRVQATVLFANIVGFTSMSEQLSPEEVTEFLNEYFSYFTMCSRMYFGTVDKFIGDCAMVIFGAPKPDEDHQFHAIACAVLMQKLTRALNRHRKQEGKAEVMLRVGINSGQMLAGVLGTNQRMEYTVVGDSVNLASRLCGEASPGEIIITQDVYSSLFADKKVIAHMHKELRVRGKEEPVNTYIVDDISLEHQLSMDNLIEDVLSSRQTT